METSYYTELLSPQQKGNQLVPREQHYQEPYCPGLRDGGVVLTVAFPLPQRLHLTTSQYRNYKGSWRKREMESSPKSNCSQSLACCFFLQVNREILTMSRLHRQCSTMTTVESLFKISFYKNQPFFFFFKLHKYTSLPNYNE